jgi:MFS family permease
LNLINRSTVESDAHHRLYSKVAARLLPLLLLMYVVSYLDRVNIGFAKLQMASSIGLSDAQYGLGAGIFFIGYCICEIPSNLALHKIGARIWIARIMIVWGLATMLTLYVVGPKSFYLARVLLGIAEAGFYPGIILYLTIWFPSKVRAQVMAIFISGIVLAGIIGGPISSGIMSGMNGLWGFEGWQWLFALEGLPAILLGIACLKFLPNGPQSAVWMTAEDRALHAKDQQADRLRTRTLPGQAHRISLVFRNKNIWLLVVANFSNLATSYAVSFWMPQMVKNFAFTKSLFLIGVITSVPFVVAGIVMIWVGRSCDRTGERRKPLIYGLSATCIGTLVTGFCMSHPLIAFFGLTLATVGTMACTPTLWSLPGTFLSGSAAAAGIALMTMVGNLSGYVSPYVIGLIKEATGSVAYGFVFLAALALAGLIAVMFAPATRNPDRHTGLVADASPVP